MERFIRECIKRQQYEWENEKWEMAIRMFRLDRTVKLIVDRVVEIEVKDFRLCSIIIDKYIQIGND